MVMVPWQVDTQPVYKLSAISLTPTFLLVALSSAIGLVCCSKAVTGANTGIGKQTALEMARKGCHVIVTSRSEEKGGKAIFDLVGQTLFQTLNNPN